MIGKKFKYPESDNIFTLKEYTPYSYRFECGHWCTDNVFIDLIEVNEITTNPMQLTFNF